MLECIRELAQAQKELEKAKYNLRVAAELLRHESKTHDEIFSEDVRRAVEPKGSSKAIYQQ